MPSTPPTSEQPLSNYALGYTDAERARLLRQAKLLERPTREVFLSAGLGAGMRVLDFGCGMGDVALLAASLVGPDGRVVGIDRDDRAIQSARQRIENLPVRFEMCGLDGLATLESEKPFDAVVGRLVLCHQADPAAALRSLASVLRPGGLVVFMEPEIEAAYYANVDRPERSRCSDLVKKTARRAGVHMRVATQLPRIFHEAGLGWPDTSLYVVSGSGDEFEGYAYIADTVASLLPLAEKFGIATAAEVNVATLPQRLRQESASTKSSLFCGVHVGAWVRV